MVSGDEDQVYFDHGGRQVSYFVHYARAIASAAMYGHGMVLLKYARWLGKQAEREEARARAAMGGVHDADDVARADDGGGRGGEAAGRDAYTRVDFTWRSHTRAGGASCRHAAGGPAGRAFE